MVQQKEDFSRVLTIRVNMKLFSHNIIAIKLVFIIFFFFKLQLHDHCPIDPTTGYGLIIYDT